MAATSLFKSVSLTFASLVFIQSLAWGVLSLLAILCIHGYLKFDNKHLEGLPKEFTVHIYALYLSPEDRNDLQFRVFPKEDFIYIFWAYFLFSIFLAFCSATHIILVAQDAKRNKVNTSTIIILILVFASCLYDAITAIIFGVDNVRLKEMPTANEYLLSVPIFMATLAAKGYVLWLANFILAITISVMLRRKIGRETNLAPDAHIFSRTNSVYDAFGNCVFSRTGRSAEEQVYPSEMNYNPYTIPVNYDIGDCRDNNALCADMPKKYPRDHQSHFVEPYEVLATRTGRVEALEAVQQQYAIPFVTCPMAQLGEPEPDYSPSPVRRMARTSSYPAASSLDGVNHFYATR